MEIVDLNGRKGLVVGIANEHSLAWWAAKHFAGAGAELAITYLNDKAKPFVIPLAESIGAPIILPCNVSVPGQLETVFDAIRSRWGRLDFAFQHPGNPELAPNFLYHQVSATGDSTKTECCKQERQRAA